MPPAPPPAPILTRLRRLWARPAPAIPAPIPAPIPLPAASPALAVIPDLHGRADLLERMMTVLAPHAPPRLVFLGDLIDRGPDSLAVLMRVHALCQADPAHICLMGNHERMLLDFLADPPAHGPRWWAAGGQETLAAMGILPAHSRDPAARMTAMADQLRAALPAGVESWLAGLPLLWRQGDLVLSHAGLDPALALEDQSEEALLWGRHRGKYRGLRADGLWSVQGHLIVPDPQIDPSRVRLDLGGWKTGRLAALWLDGAHAEVIEV